MNKISSFSLCQYLKSLPFFCPAEGFSPSVSQVPSANQNRPVRFRAANEIFAAGLLLNDMPVRSEDFQFVVVIPMEVVVESFPADCAPYAGIAVLPPKHDCLAVKIVVLIWRRELQIVLFKGSPHTLRDECGKRLDIHVNARTVQRTQIGITVLHANDRPRIAARG